MRRRRHQICPPMSETLFIAEAVRRAGCGLLLDINNVFVSAANHGFAALDYLADFPLEHVGEVHLAGHAQQADDEGELLLIDSHDRPVADAVWKLFDVVISQCGFDQADNLFVFFSCTRIIVFGTAFNRAGAVIEVLCRYGECGSPDRVAIGTGKLDLVPSLLLQFLHPMLLIIGNGCGERHGPRHVEVSEGDNECFSLFRRHDMAHDATFVASI
jgi:hypothetical protein